MKKLNFLKKNWKVLLPSIAAPFAIIDYFLKWGIVGWFLHLMKALLSIFQAYWIYLVLLLFTVALAVLWLKYYRIAKHIALSFKEEFRKDLKKNWEYHGKWEIVHGGELAVTDSEIGGITKVGQLWRDYVFEFGAVIVNDRISWIVRAQDLFNYYMIQLTPDMVRPHLRIGGQWILIAEKSHSLQIKLNITMKIRTEVRGSEVRVYVDGQEVYYNNELFSMKFLEIPAEREAEIQAGPLKPNVVIVPAFMTGRVGFRMAGKESGRFSKCKVIPL